MIKSGNINDVLVQGNRYSGSFADKSRTFSTLGPNNQSEVIKDLEAKGVKINVRPPDEDVPSLLSLLASYAVTFAVLGVVLALTLIEALRLPRDAGSGVTG